MRIAQVAPLIESVPPQLYGGTERVVAFLTDELVRLGHDVTLFASGDSRTTARLLPAWLIWVELIACLVFVAGGMAVLMIQPGQWMMALGGIVFFGAGVVLCAITLVLRRRAA